MMTPSDEPPQPNPVLTAYESFVRDTPLVTRYTLTTLFLSYVLSFFFDPTFALANIPRFTIFNFEIYRVVFSPLVCTNILSLLFAYISFLDNGKRLEHSMGSTAFAWLMLSLAFYTNISFLLICFLLYGLVGEEGFLHMNSYGIWIILLALIAIECCKAPQGSQRRLFFFTVPTLYYPLALFALFSLFGGFHLAYLLSIGVGYAYGHGHLDRFKVSESRFKQWEDTTLANFTRREGWVVGQAATGSNAWNNVGEGGGRGGFQLFSPPGRQEDAASSSGGGPTGAVRTPAEPVQPAGFPKVSGRVLGGTGTSRRQTSSAEARAARLEAIERRAAEETEDNV